MLILFYYTILMLNKISAVVLGVILCYLYGKNLFERKTIVLNSSRMKRLNNDIIKVDNRCYRIDEEVERCESKDN